MAKVYMFPQPKKLPTGLEVRFGELAKEYIEAVYATMVLLGVDPDTPEYEETLDLVNVAFTDGLIKAMNELE